MIIVLHFYNVGKCYQGIVILSSYKFHLIREHENLVLHPSNNISIEKLFILVKGKLKVTTPVLATDLQCYFTHCQEVFKKDYQLFLHLKLKHRYLDLYLTFIHLLYKSMRFDFSISQENYQRRRSGI